MIVIDTSALIAIILREPEKALFIERITSEPNAICPASVYLEAALKVDRSAAPSFAAGLDAIFPELGIELVDFTREHAFAARTAFRRFGRGRHALNFGDCMVYAVAKLADAPLLYKGEDFARTDLRSAL